MVSVEKGKSSKSTGMSSGYFSLTLDLTWYSIVVKLSR